MFTSAPMVTATVVAVRAAVPLTVRLSPVPVAPSVGDVIVTAGREGLAACADAVGATTTAKETTRMQKARSAVHGRIGNPQSRRADVPRRSELSPDGGKDQNEHDSTGSHGVPSVRPGSARCEARI